MLTLRSRNAQRLMPLLLVFSITLAGCGKDSAHSLLASGIASANKGEHSAAIIQFKSALQLDPKLLEARVRLGQSLLTSSDPVGAALELTRALDEKAPPAEVAPALAKALVLTGDYKRATTTLGALTLDDKRAQAELKTQMATAWGALGNREQTSAAVDAALAAYPDYGPALILRARVLAGQGKFTEAMTLLDQVSQRPEKFPEAWHLKGEIEEVGNRNPKAATAFYREALKLEPAFVLTHVALIGQSVQARDFSAAKTQADKLRALLPGHPMTLLIDAQLAFLDRNFKLAREKSQLLLRAFPDNLDVLTVSGGVESEMGNLLQAEAHFAKAVQLNPSSWMARHNLADVYLRLGQPAKALEALQPLLSSPDLRVEVLAVAANAALRLGDASAAEAYYMRAAKADPGNTRVQTAVALSKLTRGDASGAFLELKSLAANSTDTYADEAIFSAHLKRREFDAALAALDALQQKSPTMIGLAERRGLVHTARGDLAAARREFEGVLQKDKLNMQAVFGLTRVDIAERKHDQAVQRLQSIFKADPRNHYVLTAIAEIKASRAAPLEEVRSLLVEAIKLGPADAKPRLLLIELLVRKRQFKEALVIAQEAAAALPNDVSVLSAGGRAQLAAGDVEQAISSFRRVAAVAPDSASAYIQLAGVFRATDRRPQAEAALRKALEISPGLFPAQAALIDLLISSGRRSEALAFARKEQVDRPKLPQGYLLEGAYHARAKATDATIAAYRTGLAQTNSSEIAGTLYLQLVAVGRTAEADQLGAQWMKANPKDAKFEYMLAEMAIQRREFALAEARLRRVLEFAPDDARALNNFSWVLSQQGKPGSLAPALRAVSLAPDNPNILDTLAAAQAAEGRNAEALATQQLAVDLAPENHNLRLSLARIALKAGNKEVARAALKRLQDLGPEYPQQAEVGRLSQSL